MITRCAWVPPDDALYCAYHDEEWGVPEYDAGALFSKLCLDGMQAGLSWRVILGKREAIHARFEDFDPARLARWGEAEIEGVLGDSGVIRSRRKAEGMIKNARGYLKLADEGVDFSDYVWDFVDGAPIQNRFATIAEVPTETSISQALAKDLKRRGFSFCGPVIVYAFMQAVGMVNDHTVDCHRHAACAEYRR